MTTRTPEQIADAIIAANYSDPYSDNPLYDAIIDRVVDADGIRVMVAEAAREAQRDAEPQFAPEGEPDDWRDDAEDIDTAGEGAFVEVSWRVWTAEGRKLFDTDFTLSAPEAKAALAALSEQSRKDNA